MKNRSPKKTKSSFGDRRQKHNRTPRPSDKPTAAEGPMRLNKYIAHCGICARRQAAEYVKKGDVQVNGTVEVNPGYLVQEGDQVSFKGKVVELEKTKVYLLLNKPKNTITTVSDEKGRKTVLDLIGDDIKERIFPVGRLDRMTTGLLLLTNDGDLAKKLSHPSHQIAKFYHATLDKNLSHKHLQEIKDGLSLEDGLAPVDSVGAIGGKRNEIGIELHIGRNRIVRRIFQHLGYEVLKLDRTYYAGLTKKDIGRGRYRHLTKQEVIMLKHFK